jgi:hypothetical protein
MALPAIGAKAPVPIPLPDVRRLDQMPSLPAWVASRVASMKDECQPALADGKYRVVPTLPASLILSPTERAEVERHIGELDALCKQTPINGDEWEAATLIVLTKLMLALPSSQQNEAGAEAAGEAFQAALDDLPTWSVAAAVRRWYRGDCGENERGQPYDYHWRPSPAELRRIALVEKWRVEARARTLRKLLAAEPLIDFDEEHCAKMHTRLAELFRFRTIPPVGSDGSGGRISTSVDPNAYCGTSSTRTRSERREGDERPSGDGRK